MTRSFIRIFEVLIGLALAGAFRPACSEAAPAPVLVVSMDGFRWDYCDKYPAETPHLRRLREEGVSSRELIPVYPSNTFPNHYSIATGLYPAHHGVINNEMYDAALHATFQYNRGAPQRDARWWGGEPIWITAVLQGKASACDFWPGSEAELKGVRPTYWRPYDYAVPFESRLTDLIAHWNMGEARRPAITLFYLEEANSAGHNFGPDSPQTAAAVRLCDDRLGKILNRAAAERIALNLVVLSDHGMTPVSPQRWMFLDDYVDLTSVQIDFQIPVVGLRPLQGTPEDLLAKLVNLPHARAFLVKDLPRRFHIETNPRTPPVWIVPELGWQVGRRSLYNVAAVHAMAGNHGFDNALQDMHGILIANGPAFKSRGQRLAPVENIQIYNLLCAVAGLKPAPNDGDDRLVKAFLKP
jgi:predicted AlkP superfamily pyrophosphatase or phosphodiesterase